MQELPLYTCHKKVRATKVAGWKLTKESLVLHLDNGDNVPVHSTFLKGNDVRDLVGGYFVVYEDGYQSWSPAKAFEEGYTKD